MDRASFAGAAVLGLLVLAQAACGGGAAPGSSSSSAAPSAPSAPVPGGTLQLSSAAFADGANLAASLSGITLARSSIAGSYVF